MQKRLNAILSYWTNVEVDLPADFNIITGDPERHRPHFLLPCTPPILIAETIYDGRTIIRRRNHLGLREDENYVQ